MGKVARNSAISVICPAAIEPLVARMAGETSEQVTVLPAHTRTVQVRQHSRGRVVIANARLSDCAFTAIG